MRPMNSKARKVEHLVAKFANERRASRGLDRLDSDRALTAAAREHSRWMARNGFYGHFKSDSRSQRRLGPSDRVKKYDYVSENIDQVVRWDRPPKHIAAEALDDWMTSKGHRENILKSDYVRQGVGVWKNGPKVYLTQMFVPHWNFSYEEEAEDPIGDFIEDVKRRLPV